MKIHSVHFSNINCLAGEWTVDFDDPALAGGLFLLSGPTGAGKSSVLDAITLALFGKTARQEKISASRNEVMTRGTHACFAEVVFTGADGIRYLSHWGQASVHHRDGSYGLQPPARTLSVVGTGEDLTPHLAAKGFIEDKVGFGFADFTRTILLEQGRFDEFLHAKEEARAAILEQATSTSQFSALGSRINERAREESARLREKNAAVAALAKSAENARDPEELEAEAAARDAAAKAAGARADALRREAAWLKEEGGIATEEASIAAADSALAGRRSAYDAALATIKASDRARALLPDRAAAEAKENAATKARNAAAAAAKEAATSRKAVDEAKELADALVPRREASRKADEERAAADAAAQAARERFADDTKPAADARLRSLREKQLLAARVKSLDEHRKGLRPGEPCPLCGSTEHPYAEGLPTPDDVQAEIDREQDALDAAQKAVAGLEAKAADARRRADETRTALQKAETTANTALVRAQAREANAADNVRKTTEELDAANQARDEALATFAARLAQAGFASERNWRDACLSDAVRAAAERTRDGFAGDKAALDGRRQALETRKRDHAGSPDRPDAIRDATTVAAELAAATKDQTDETTAAATLRAEIAALNANRANLVRAETEAAVQKETARKWNRLDDILGGPDGKRFRLYAQGRNLRTLLAAASPRLEEMSDGDYRFEWDPSSESLEPLVRDRHCERPRPVSNLSGGESFLASLALALSFANFNKRRAPIGTLFLDEGFGTLDDAALGRALDTLETLRGNERQVGIVTHVGGVKERVQAHIDVEKRGNGHSVLSGPGVTAGAPAAQSSTPP